MLKTVANGRQGIRVRSGFGDLTKHCYQAFRSTLGRGCKSGGRLSLRLQIAANERVKSGGQALQGRVVRKPLDC